MVYYIKKMMEKVMFNLNEFLCRQIDFCGND